MSMLQRTITNNAAPSFPSQWYWQDTNWAASATNKYSIQSPDAVQVDVGGTSLEQYSKQTLDLSLDTTWDVGQNIGIWAAEHTYAVGDLVRATATWIADGANNVKTNMALPSATGVTSGGYTFSDTSHLSDRHRDWMVFRGSLIDDWILGAALPQSVMVSLPFGIVINKYKLGENNNNINFPTAWKLQGSIDATALVSDTEGSSKWTTLDTQTGITPPSPSSWYPFNTFSNSIAYLKYRLVITAMSTGNGYSGLGAFFLVEKPSLIYRCTTAGTSHATTEPTWGTTVGGTTAEADSTLVWTAYIDNTIASNRAGQDFYVYAVSRAEGSIPKFLLSPHSTVPTGYTAETSRKIAGFHCLCNAAGTISGHDLTGYVTGDIIPTSIWDLNRKSLASNGNVGQAYNDETGEWAGLYPLSGTKTAPTIIYGGTILVSTDWNDAVSAAKVLNMKLPTDASYQSIAAGSNEQTVISGAALPTTVTGAVDSAGRRMISNIGCEMCCGALDYWLDEQSYRFDGAAAHTHTVTLIGGGPVATISLGASGGTDYTDGDTLTISGGTTPATATATVVDGVVTAVTLTATVGTGYHAASDVATTGGTGTGCQINVLTISSSTVTSSAASADVAPALDWYDLPGSFGQIYRQGTYGDVKLTAGGKATGTAANAGSRGRDASNWRWNTSTGIGIRLVANSIEK